MREILFKAKRKDNGEWIEGYYYQKPNPCSENGLPITHAISDLPPFGAVIIPETLSQYTGLKDVNGVKIFENDIVKHDFGAEQIGVQYAVVDYDDRYASFMINPIYDWMYCDKNDCEVIGNRFDNPELLHGKE